MMQSRLLPKDVTDKLRKYNKSPLSIPCMSRLVFDVRFEDDGSIDVVSEDEIEFLDVYKSKYADSKHMYTEVPPTDLTKLIWENGGSPLVGFVMTKISTPFWISRGRLAKELDVEEVMFARGWKLTWKGIVPHRQFDVAMAGSPMSIADAILRSETARDAQS